MFSKYVKNYSIIFEDNTDVENLDFLTKRKLAVVDNGTGQKILKIDHEHFKGWEDYQVPEDASMKAY